MNRKYEIGRWYPHDGGPCPVPENAIVEYVWHYEDVNQCGVLRRIAGDDGSGGAPSWDSILKFRVTEYPPQEETRTGTCWAKLWKEGRPSLYDVSTFLGAVHGTYTVTTIDGKPTRIVWEADE